MQKSVCMDVRWDVVSGEHLNENKQKCCLAQDPNPISDIAAAAFWTASPWHIATSIIVATYAQITGCTHPSGTLLIHDNDEEAHPERL